MKRRTWLWCVGALALMAAPVAQATTVIDLQVEDLAVVAPVVVVGEVNQVASNWNADGTRVYTEVTVTSSEVLKGKIAASFTIKTIGGVVDGQKAALAGAPRFQEGERVLLFLEPREDGTGYLTLGLYQGKFQVFKDPRTGQDLVLRDGPEHGVQVVTQVGIAGIERVRSLDEVRALVQKAGGAQ